MTTDRELHDVLATEADGPARPAPAWDDVVRRGRHHRRVARVRTGLVAGGLAALAVIGGIAVTDRTDDEDTGVVANDPDPAPVTSQPAFPATDLAAARAVGVFVTVIGAPSDPATGFDPCVDQHPRVMEAPDQVTVELVPASLSSGQPWAACQASPFSGWGTIELTDPLGSRRLVDASDGQEIQVLDDADLVFPASLPAPFDVDHWDEFAHLLPTELAVYEREWTFSWVAGDVVLNLSAWSLDGEHPDGCTDGEAVTIGGLAGSLCTDASHALLSWIDGGSARILELVDVSGEPLPAGIDLVAVATGLEPLA
jgi:hypothetical protein